jgi:exopolysaccharide biosynthesis protein
MSRIPSSKVKSMSRRKAIAVGGIVAIVLALGAMSLALANSHESESTQAAVVSTTQPAPDTTETGSAATTETSSHDTATSGADAGSGDIDYTATDSTYESATASISIEKVSTGSGNSALTYYVADVQLTSGTILQAGLADGFESGRVDYTSSIAEANNAILAINGDYCTARNSGVIIRNGVLYQDVPTRMGLAIYKDGTMRVYDETEISAKQLLADGVWNTYSFGPAVLIDGTIPDGIDTTEVEDIGEKHTIMGAQPRTAVGIVDTNHFVFVVVDGREAGYSEGVTLSELGQIFKDLGCTTAYNLDGGGSSAMYFMGDLVNNPLGEGKERGISDILYVG